MNSVFEIVTIVILSLITVIFFVAFIRSLFRKTNEGTNKTPPFDTLSNKIIFDISGIEKITSASLQDKKTFFEVFYQIKKGLDLAQTDPYVIDAIFTYLKTNMLQGEKKVQDYLMPLFTNLAESGKVSYNHFIGSFFNRLDDEKLINRDEFTDNLKNHGNQNLIESLIEFDIKSSENLSKENLTMILELSAETNNTFLIRKYSDYLADLFKTDQKKVISLLEGIMPTATLLNIKDFKSEKNKPRNNFVTKFLIKVFVDSAGDFDKLRNLFKSIESKNSLILEAVLDIGKHDILSKVNLPKKWVSSEIKKGVYADIEESGINQWNQGIGNIQTGRNINNRFFVEYEGVNQRDVLFEYLPFLVSLYNNKYDNLKFEDSTAFYKLSMRMISFAPYSVIGYISVLGLLDLICHIYDKDSMIIEKVVVAIYSEKPASKFFLFILLDNLLKAPNQSDEFYKETLRLSKEFIIPDILKGKHVSNVFYFLDNKTVDIEINWHLYKEVVDFVFKKADSTNLSGISNTIAYCAYLPDIRVGIKLFNYFIEKDLYKKQEWNEPFIKLASALYSRNSQIIKIALKEFSIDFKYLNEWMLLNATNKESSEIREARSYQTNWNDFLITGIIRNRRLKFHIVRDLIGGLTQSNSVEEYSKEFRRFILETLKTFILGEVDFNKELTVEKIIELSESKRTTNGKIHIISENIK